MKVGVCLKQVPASDSRIKINADQTGIDTEGIKWEINPYDEYALEAAIQLVEKKIASGMVIISLGGKAADKRIKDGIARAVKAKPEAVRLDDAAFAGSDSLGTARALAAAAKKAEVDLLLCGKQAIDNDNSQVPAMVAELLDWAQLSCVETLEVTADSVKGDRVMGGGSLDTIQASLPAVVSVDKGVNTPRFASLPGIMKAKRAKIAVWSAVDLGFDGQVGAGAALVSQGAYAEPPARPAGKIVEGADAVVKAKELVRLLREEAKVL